MPADVAAVNLADRDTTKTPRVSPQERDGRPDHHDHRDSRHPYFFSTQLVRHPVSLTDSVFCAGCGMPHCRVAAVVLLMPFEQQAALAVGVCHSCAARTDHAVMEAAARAFDPSAEPLHVCDEGHA